jgi:Cd2+/Zn2+-exporting ATPase/Cu+-exporting ATPase
MSELTTAEVPIAGMDCAECTQHVRHAIAALPGVQSVDVFLASERARIRLDPAEVSLDAIRKAVEGAGYSVPETRPELERSSQASSDQAETLQMLSTEYRRRILLVLGILFGVVLFVVVIGEWLGLFEQLTRRVPWFVGLALVIAAGYPVFRNVVRATLKGQIISHTLMTLGVIAALAMGQWATALVVVFFMRVGDSVEHFTIERARRALKDLSAMTPATARVLRGGSETEVPVGQVNPGEIVIVRPGERIPVDGEVLDGQATVDQAAITGEAMPVEAGPGMNVYAATIARFGHLRVRATHIGADSTFGRVVSLVEEAEANRAEVQRAADRFSAYFLPIVLAIAGLTLVIRHDPLAAAAVLVVACSCSLALATPIAMLASIGAAAKRGLLIKGGRVIESLAKADVLLIDKTGTLTLGKPKITDIVIDDSRFTIDDSSATAQVQSKIANRKTEILQLAASAERYSEHPLADAVRDAAHQRGLRLLEPREFAVTPGHGVRAVVDGHRVTVGSRRSLADIGRFGKSPYELEAEGKIVLFVQIDDELAGLLAASDTLRPEVPAALDAVRDLGIRHIELLTGDNERTASELAKEIGVSFRANLLPEDKIRIVREYQSSGHVVVMVGDGVNDAPALAQADTGIAMGAVGADVAIDAAHVALLREDWTLVPDLLQISRRTMRVVRMNLGFTAVYNVVGLTLAALGILPPVLAAAAQSLPDLGILGNSSRLLRQK